MPYPEQPNDEGGSEPAVTLTGEEARQVADLSVALSRALRRSRELRVQSCDPGRQERLERALAMVENRRLRNRYFSPGMFGEPAWDILLELYVTDTAGSRQSIGRLSKAIGTPVSTAVRWIDYLEKKRLIEREPHPTDRRIIFIQLLDKARELMDAYFSVANDKT